MRTLIAILIISTAVVVGSASAQTSVFFPDAALKAAVEQALGKTDPTPTDMLGLTALDASLREISDLTGLEYATNLQTLDLSRNQIWHLSALSALSNLQWLSLNNNYISNISVVSGFTNLKYLDLHDQNSQKITDISPLAGLSQLNTAYLYRIGISNISILAGLHNIHTLYLEENLISDISPLLSMTSLVYLNILLNPLNQQACDLHIPQIRANNPGVSIVYRPCAPWSLTISSTAGGSVTSPGTGVFTYGHGALVQLQAQANPGFVFVNWSGTFFTTQNPTFVTIDQDHQIQANFAKLP